MEANEAKKSVTAGDLGQVQITTEGTDDDGGIERGSDIVFADRLDAVPRDLTGLRALTRFELLVLAVRLGLMNTPEAKQAWWDAASHEGHARRVQEGLAAWDRASEESSASSAGATRGPTGNTVNAVMGPGESCERGIIGGEP